MNRKIAFFRGLSILAAVLTLGLATTPSYTAGDAGAVFVPGPNLNVARMAHHIATFPDGRVMVFGGRTTGFVPLGSAEAWNPASNAFTLMNMNYTHECGAFVKLPDGRYLLAGGTSSPYGVGYSATAEIYDPAANTFTTVGSMKYPRTTCAGVALTSGKALVVGNWYNYTYATYGDLFNPATNTFSATGPLNTPRSRPLVLPTNDGGAVVFAGQGVYGGYVEQVEYYNPATNSFSVLSGSLIPGEPGWVLDADEHSRALEAHKLSDGRYLFRAYKNAVSAWQLTLFTFDPASKQFAKFATNPPLPDSSVVWFHAPVVDAAGGKAYLLADIAPYTTPRSYRLYTVDLTSGAINAPTGSFTLPAGVNYFSLYASALLGDGRLFFIGGSYQNNFTPYNNTFFATPTGAPPPVNQPPVANPGPNQTVHVGRTVTLDGSGSSDPDGNLPLQYQWSFAPSGKPEGSSAALSDPASMTPSFVADKEGTYVVQLVVRDSLGAASQPAFVTISTSNTAPVADAGPDQVITVIGATVQLNALTPGRASYDPDGDPITFKWSLVSQPAGSTATLTGADTATPAFVADMRGNYLVELVVRDPWTASPPAPVKVSFANIAPVANAGTSQSVPWGTIVTLDGSGSSDANGDPLTYQWSLATRPTGSSATISTPTAMAPTFIPDLPGLYVAQLVVNDGFVNSDPSTVQVQVTATEALVIKNLQDLIALIGSLDCSVFKNCNMRNAMINKLNAVIAQVEGDQYQEAVDKLTNDLLAKTDGCAASGKPDKNDWIIDASAQGLVYPEFLEVIDEIRMLM